MPISPESHYCLDGALECCDITVDVYASILHRRYDVDGLMDRLHDATILEFTQAYMDVHRAWYPGANTLDKSVSDFAIILDTEFQLEEIYKCVRNSLIDAYQESNGQKSFDSIHGLERGWRTIYIPSEADLTQPQNIDFILRNDPHCSRWFGLFDTQIKTALENKDRLPIRDYAYECRRLSAIEQDRRREEFEAWRVNRQEQEDQEYVDRIQRFIESPKHRDDFKRAKKVLKKSIVRFKSLFGEEKIKTFLSGHELMIEGTDFNYRVSKSLHTNLLEHSASPTSPHVPYKLEIMTKDGVILGEGCVIFKKTPVIDQIIALTLFAQNNERELIKNINFFNTSPEFSSNELIIQIKDEKRREAAERIKSATGEADRVLMGMTRRDIDGMNALYDRLGPSIIEATRQYLVDSFIDLPPTFSQLIVRPVLKADQLQSLTQESDESRHIEQLLLEYSGA